MAVLVIATMYLLVILFKELIPQWKSGPKKLFWVNTVFATVGYVLIVMSGFDLHTPSLMRPVDQLFRMLFNL